MYPGDIDVHRAHPKRSEISCTSLYTFEDDFSVIKDHFSIAWIEGMPLISPILQQ